MPIPCFMSSCSITLDTDDLTGQLVAEARLADTGSLDCVDRADPDTTDGVYVKVAGLATDQVGYNQFDSSPATVPPSGTAFPGAVPPCGQSLARTADGTLFAYPEGALTDSYAGSGGALLTVGGSTNYNAHQTINNDHTFEFDITNPLDCTVWCHYLINEMKVVGKRRPDSGPDPHVGTPPYEEAFYITGYGEIVVPGDIITTNLHRFDIHGSWSGEGNSPQHQQVFHMHAIFPIPGNSFVTLTNRIFVVSKYHFDMSEGLTESGVAFLHPVATFWRDEPPRVGD